MVLRTDLGGGKSGRGIAAYGGSEQGERRANGKVIVSLAGESEKRVGEEDADADGQRWRNNDVGLPGRGEDLWREMRMANNGEERVSRWLSEGGT
ncbi:hypothetical protein TIFTF001_031569 [Ficus carica]|uniref:Uncharacterized protein n=1 Tax=Ficus carica TaxID=3494 RepID=A0AA88J4D4_FICCA|nr:hypothetical protein TIFTF001_031569 [Ficus carica]